MLSFFYKIIKLSEYLIITLVLPNSFAHCQFFIYLYRERFYYALFYVIHIKLSIFITNVNIRYRTDMHIVGFTPRIDIRSHFVHCIY